MNTTPTIEPFTQIAREIPADWPDDSIIVVNVPKSKTASSKKTSFTNTTAGQWRALIGGPANFSAPPEAKRLSKLVELAKKVVARINAGSWLYHEDYNCSCLGGLFVATYLGYSQAQLKKVYDDTKMDDIDISSSIAEDLFCDETGWGAFLGYFMSPENKSCPEGYSLLVALAESGLTPLEVGSLEGCDDTDVLAKIENTSELLLELKRRFDGTNTLFGSLLRRVGYSPMWESVASSFDSSDVNHVLVYLKAQILIWEEQAEKLCGQPPAPETGKVVVQSTEIQPELSQPGPPNNPAVPAKKFSLHKDLGIPEALPFIEKMRYLNFTSESPDTPQLNDLQWHGPTPTPSTNLLHDGWTVIATQPQLDSIIHDILYTDFGKKFIIIRPV